MELAVADVERDHAGGPRLQEAVREAAGRGADVQADRSRRVDAECVEGRGELVAPSADVRAGFDHRHRDVHCDEVPSLAIEAGRVTLPHSDLAGHDQGLGATA